MNNQNGFSLLEILLSLSIGLFLVAMMIKLYGLQESLHYDVQSLSQLNHRAIIARLILTNEVKNSTRPVNILEQGHKIEVDHKVFYVSKDGLYIKKNNDFSVELVPGIKNLTAKNINNTIEISFTVFIKEKLHETKGLYINNSLNLHFFVKRNCHLKSGNVCE